jgi:quercetin dioxygenase-like cupin family protein
MSNTITPTVFYRTLKVEGLEIFYREAGPRDAPTLLLLHGFPVKKIIISVFLFTFGFATATHAQQVNTLLTKQLPEAPGKEIEVITVNYAPGAVDAIHRHDAHAVVYVLDGEVEMQVRGGTLRRLGPGQVFYESPEDVHTVSRNASKTKPAKFVVFFIKNEGAPILTPIH